jgi:hypothetical protein
MSNPATEDKAKGSTANRDRRAIIFLLCFLATLFGLAIWGGYKAEKAREESSRPENQGIPIDQSTLGEDWPLTLQSGRIWCATYIRSNGVEVPNAVIFYGEDNQHYAVNGTATSVTNYPSILTIAQPNLTPGMEDTTKSVGPIISIGLEQCR